MKIRLSLRLVRLSPQGGLPCLLALARCGLLAAGLLAAAGSQCEGRRREGDESCDLGDGGHGNGSPPFLAGCFFQQCSPTFQIAKEKPDRL